MRQMNRTPMANQASVLLPEIVRLNVVELGSELIVANLVEDVEGMNEEVQSAWVDAC